ncbi:MAG: MFS transporter [Solirubrobacteraceae bacterium]
MAPAASRRILLLVSAIVLVDICFYAAITPLLPTYVDDLGLSKAQAGVLSGAYAAGTLAASLPGGWLASRWGARPTLLLGLGLLAAASVAFGAADSFGLLVVARVAQGVGGAASWAAGLAWLVQVTPPARRGQAIGTALGAAVAGAMGGPVLGGLAHELSPLAAFGGIALLAVGLSLAVLATASPGAAPQSGTVRVAFRQGAVQSAFWLTMLPALFFGVFGVLVPLRLDDLGAGAIAVAAIFLAGAAVEACASPLAGRLSDRRGRARPLKLGLAGVVVACLVLPLPTAVWSAAVVALLATAAGGLLTAPAMALLSDTAERTGLAQGLAFGLVNLAWAGGQVTGSLGGASLAETTSDTAVYVLMAAVVAATLAWLLTRDISRS